MGTLTDAGIVKDGKATDEAFRGYVKDVIKMCSTGEGLFPDGIKCSKKVDPVPGADMLQLEDKKKFPEFHSVWRPRYDKMVSTLDADGDFQLAKTLPGIGTAFMDPTAVAVAMGAHPPNMDLEKALAAMLAAQAKLVAFDPFTPPAFQAFIGAYMSDLNPLDPAILDKAKNIIIPSFPIPLIPQLPNPVLLDFGYTEQYKFDLDLALAPVKTQAKMMLPAVIIGDLPGIMTKLLQGDVGALIQFICDQTASEQPEPMSTSSLEIAAQQILQQHQVKMQALTFVGQNIGSGVVTSGLARAPGPAGLGILRDLPPEPEPPIDYQSYTSGSGVGQRRPVSELKPSQMLRDFIRSWEGASANGSKIIDDNAKAGGITMDAGLLIKGNAVLTKQLQELGCLYPDGTPTGKPVPPDFAQKAFNSTLNVVAGQIRNHFANVPLSQCEFDALMNMGWNGTAVFHPGVKQSDALRAGSYAQCAQLMVTNATATVFWNDNTKTSIIHRYRAQYFMFTNGEYLRNGDPRIMSRLPFEPT